MVYVIAFRGEDESRVLATPEDVTLTAGGYRTGAAATLRDPNGDEIAYLWGSEGWIDTDDGEAWDDIVVTDKAPED